MEELHKLQARRAGALGLAAGGMGLMFLGSFSAQFALGGAVMVLLGLLGVGFWSWRIRRVKGDPWAYDPDLDGPDPARPRDPRWDNEGDEPDEP